MIFADTVLNGMQMDNNMTLEIIVHSGHVIDLHVTNVQYQMVNKKTLKV